MDEVPWWVSWIASLASVAIGIGLKWLIDLVNEKKKLRREDRLRFMDERRVAYAQVLLHAHDLIRHRRDFRRVLDASESASAQIATTTAEILGLVAGGRSEEAGNRIAENRAANAATLELAEAVHGRIQQHLSELKAAGAILDLIAPESVSDVARKMMAAISTDDYDRADAELSNLTQACRRDLGIET